MKKKKKILIGASIVLIVFILIVLSFRVSSLTGRDKNILDIIDASEINDYIKIDFISVTDVDDEKAPKDGVANVNYTLENISNEDRWINLEIAVYDQNGEQIAMGYIDQENLPKGEKITSSFLLDIKPGERKNVDVANMKVVNAASRVNSQSSDDEEMVGVVKEGIEEKSAEE